MFAAALIYILAVMSPGPNFLLVSRFAASNSIRAGVGASIGIVMVGLMFSISSVTGLALLIDRYPAFNRTATVLGAILIFDWIFVEPRWSLKPTDPEYFFTFAITLCVGWAVSRLAVRARAAAERERQAAVQAEAERVRNTLLAADVSSSGAQSYGDGSEDSVTVSGPVSLNTTASAGVTACSSYAVLPTPVVVS